MKPHIKHFIRDDSGATAIEYSLLASLIGLVIIASVSTIGPKLSGIFTNVSGNLG
jgi:pilus assembly protein Flp/PilA